MKTIQKPDNGIVLIGAGNVGVHLGKALKEAGYFIRQVYSRTIVSAEILGNELKVPFTTNLRNITCDADVYIFSIKDDALPVILEEMKPVSGLYIHTAGSVPMHIFQPYTSRYGVLYPLQTFTKGKEITFREIPVFIEVYNESDQDLLLNLAESISGNVRLLSSEKRKYLHLAAVFACNFTNHMYTLAADILEQQELPWESLIPLIRETAEKAAIMHPKKAQTGPAVRYDRTIVDKQRNMFGNDQDKKEIYELISKSIHRKSMEAK